ncbi:MAG TPA: hypothetical protein VK463_04405 [Desulfomonilaceae bacterium]|nr:hypothetical protein [Desulfomonilaceae bacterium]
MARQFAQSIILVLIMCLPAGSAERDISGTWEAEVMGSKVVAHVNQDGSAISGVAYISNSSGGKASYQFVGNINQGNLSGTLAGGHSFSAKVYSDGQVAGVVRTKDGHYVPVSATRR